MIKVFDLFFILSFEFFAIKAIIIVNITLKIRIARTISLTKSNSLLGTEIKHTIIASIIIDKINHVFFS